MIRVADANERLILKAHMSQNRTFKIELNVMKRKCLATATRKDEWMWHYHLDFRDIRDLKRRNMFSELSEINISNEVCVEASRRQLLNSYTLMYIDQSRWIWWEVTNTLSQLYMILVEKLWTYLIKKKSEVIEVFSKFKSMVESSKFWELMVVGSMCRKISTSYVRKKDCAWGGATLHSTAEWDCRKEESNHHEYGSKYVERKEFT